MIAVRSRDDLYHSGDDISGLSAAAKATKPAYPSSDVYRTRDIHQCDGDDSGQFHVHLYKSQGWFDTGIPVTIAQGVDVWSRKSSSIRYTARLHGDPIPPGRCGPFGEIQCLALAVGDRQGTVTNYYVSPTSFSTPKLRLEDDAYSDVCLDVNVCDRVGMPTSPADLSAKQQAQQALLAIPDM
jgi:hypothetical protein